MFWIVTTSFWRNRRRYRFFIIALMLASLVTSLGLSAVGALSSIWRLPITAIYGGHIQIATRNNTGTRQYDLFPRDAVTRIVKGIYPDAVLTYNLIVPTRPLSTNLIFEYVIEVTGRDGGLDTWYLSPLWRSGAEIGKTDDTLNPFFVRDQSPGGRKFTEYEQLAIAQYDTKTSTWTFSDAKEVQPKIVGTVRYPMGYAYTHLATMQRLAQAPTDQVTTIGIGLPRVNAVIDTAKLAELRTALTAEFPQLEATTVDEFTEEFTLDLVPLKDAAKRYLPIVLGIALMVVVATALAVVQSRRRELSMLRVIGMSARQVWMLFLAEAVLAAVLACAVGLLLSKTLNYLIFCARLSMSIFDLLKTEVSLLPFTLSLVITITVVAVVSALAVAKAMPKVLRNA